MSTSLRTRIIGLFCLFCASASVTAKDRPAATLLNEGQLYDAALLLEKKSAKDKTAQKQAAGMFLQLALYDEAEARFEASGMSRAAAMEAVLASALEQGHQLSALRFARAVGKESEVAAGICEEELAAGRGKSALEWARKSGDAALVRRSGELAFEEASRDGTRLLNSGMSSSFTTLRFSPDGRFLVGSNGRLNGHPDKVNVLDLRESLASKGEAGARKVKLDWLEVYDFAIDSEGRFLAVLGRAVDVKQKKKKSDQPDKYVTTLRIERLDTGLEVRSLVLNSKDIPSDYSPNGNGKLVYAGNLLCFAGKTLVLFDPLSGTVGARLEQDQGTDWLRLLPDGKRLVGLRGRTEDFCTYDARTLSVLKVGPGGVETIQAATAELEDGNLIVWSEDGRLKVVDADTMAPRPEFSGVVEKNGKLVALRLDPVGSRFITVYDTYPASDAYRVSLSVIDAKGNGTIATGTLTAPPAGDTAAAYAYTLFMKERHSPSAAVLSPDRSCLVTLYDYKIALTPFPFMNRCETLFSLAREFGLKGKLMALAPSFVDGGDLEGARLIYADSGKTEAEIYELFAEHYLEKKNNQMAAEWFLKAGNTAKVIAMADSLIVSGSDRDGVEKGYWDAKMLYQAAKAPIEPLTPMAARRFEALRDYDKAIEYYLKAGDNTSVKRLSFDPEAISAAEHGYIAVDPGDWCMATAVKAGIAENQAQGMTARYYESLKDWRTSAKYYASCGDKKGLVRVSIAAINAGSFSDIEDSVKKLNDIPTYRAVSDALLAKKDVLSAGELLRDAGDASGLARVAEKAYDMGEWTWADDWFKASKAHGAAVPAAKANDASRISLVYHEISGVINTRGARFDSRLIERINSGELSITWPIPQAKLSDTGYKQVSEFGAALAELSSKPSSREAGRCADLAARGMANLREDEYAQTRFQESLVAWYSFCSKLLKAMGR